MGPKKDKDIVLQMEMELFAFMNNFRLTQTLFPSLTARHRLLLHRLADRFNLGHSVVGEETLEVYSNSHWGGYVSVYHLV